MKTPESNHAETLNDAKAKLASALERQRQFMARCSLLGISVSALSRWAMVSRKDIQAWSLSGYFSGLSMAGYRRIEAVRAAVDALAEVVGKNAGGQ